MKPSRSSESSLSFLKIQIPRPKAGDYDLVGASGHSDNQVSEPLLESSAKRYGKIFETQSLFVCLAVILRILVPAYLRFPENCWHIKNKNCFLYLYMPHCILILDILWIACTGQIWLRLTHHHKGEGRGLRPAYPEGSSLAFGHWGTLPRISPRNHPIDQSGALLFQIIKECLVWQVSGMVS